MIKLLFGNNQIFLLAVWSGLAAGLLEAVTAILLRGVQGYAIRVSPDILWIAPAFNLILFLLLSVGLNIVLKLLGKSPDLRLAVGLFCWVTLFGLLLLIGKLDQVAALVLSLGISFQVGRLVRGREQRVLAFFRKSAAFLITAAVIIGVAGAMWDGWQERRMIGRLAKAEPGAPNVLLITLDTLRADHLSSYGYNRETSPNIDRLASGGAVFEHAFASSSWTLPSHATMFTGRLAHEHMADWFDPLNDRYPTLAEALYERGYLTGAFVANTAYVTPECGLARGFTRFDVYGNSLIGDAGSTVYGKKLALNLLPRLGYFDIPGRKRAADVNDEFLRWLDQSEGQPFFAFLNYFDLHDPYITSDPYSKRFSGEVTSGDVINFQFQPGSFRRKPELTEKEIQVEIDSYDGCLTYLDSKLGELFAELERRGLDKNTLIIITSDHGESFGNHDLFGHGNSLYLETLHIPMILYWPGKIPAGIRPQQLVGLNQIPSTIMELVGAGDNSAFPGASLTASLYGERQAAASDPVMSELSPGRFKDGPPGYPTRNGGLKSLLTERWHLILGDSGSEELYAWREDRQESRNLAGDPESQIVVQQLKHQLEAMMTAGGNQQRQALLSGSK
jgi:arylsulfatase A-like enzyme